MNQNNNKGKYIAWIFLPIILSSCLQVCIEFVGIQGIAVYVMSTFKGKTLHDLFQLLSDSLLNGIFNDLIQVSYAVLVIILFGFIYKKMFKKDNKFGFFKSSSDPKITFAGMVLFVVAMQYICVYLMAALSIAFPEWLLTYTTILKSAGIGSSMSILTSLYAIVLGPICEEILFRGITFSAGRQAFSGPVAIVIQAVLFGIYHRNMFQGCYAFVFGLGLGYVMYLYDDIAITILLHIAFNILGTYGSKYLPMGGNTVGGFFVWFLGSLIAGYAAITLLKKSSAKVNPQEESTDI